MMGQLQGFVVPWNRATIEYHKTCAIFEDVMRREVGMRLGLAARNLARFSRSWIDLEPTLVHIALKFP